MEIPIIKSDHFEVSQNQNYNILYWVLGLILLFLVSKEAVVLPLTHDEGNTIHCSSTTVWDIITYKDPVPNNHILNTLLIKINQSIFGKSLLAARLANILSFIPFFIFTVLIGKKLFESVWPQLLFVFSLVLQPFILDFYAVTRGYGLSLSLMIISIYYMLLRIRSGQRKDLILCILFAALGVYANFTLLNYFIPVCLFLLYEIYKRNFNKNKSIFYQEFAILFSLGIILISAISVPVFKMVSTKQFVYWGTKGFFEDTVKSLIISLRSGVEYFGTTHEVIYIFITSLITLIIVFGNILNWKNKLNTTLLWMTALLLATIVYNQLQFIIFKVPFLNARTALFFVPLVCIPLVLSIQVLFQSFKYWPFVIIITFLSVQMQHFIRGYSVNSNFEWYYDQNTYQVLDHIKSMVESGQAPKPAKINCYWIFYPSLSYHVSQKYAEYIEIAPWDTKIKDDGNSLFYYTEGSEKDQLSEKFDVVKDFGYGARFLMRAKGK